MAYGSPDSLEDVEAYYEDILRGRKPTETALRDLIDRYKAIGGGSPLLKITKAKAARLQETLGEEYKVYIGMRHWHPYIRKAVLKMKEDGVKEALGLIMAPHYSRLSIGKYIETVESALVENEADIDFQYIESWGAEPLFIDALSSQVAKGLEMFSVKERKNLHVIFTAHSLPERIMTWNDPYIDQLMESSRLVSEKADLPHWHFSFQSAGRTPEKWLGPDLSETIAELDAAEIKAILVCPVGFIADHLEVLYDIDIEAKNQAMALGMHLERVPSLNAHQSLIRLFETFVKERL